MDIDDVVLKVKCSERDGEVVRSVRPASLSIENLRRYWNHLKEFDVLFDEFVQGDVDAFIRRFVGQNGDGEPVARGLIWEVDDVGILFLTEFNPYYREATGHYTFWDGAYRGREELVREMLRYVFDDLDLRIIRAEVPLYAQPAMVFAEKLGFVKEGRKRDARFYKGQWFDVNMYSIRKEEIE